MNVYHLTEEDDEEQALIRIYCDNDRIFAGSTNPDGRWELKEDRDDDPNPNSRRPPFEQEFFDEGNDLQHYGLMCSTDDNLFAISYKSPYVESGEESEEPEGRMTITVSNYD